MQDRRILKRDKREEGA
jgi:hypothetical protein